jgi:DNA-binding CsgD family transcriptional regulator
MSLGGDMDLSRHSLTYNVSKIQPITAHLKDQLGFNYFNFIRNFNDNTRICLTTNSDWPMYFCEKKLYTTAPFETDKDQYSKYEFIFWPLLRDNIVFREASQFNIKHSLTIVDKGKNYMDFYHFGRDIQNEENYENILSNRDFLTHFILYFKDAAQQVIKNSDLLKFPEFSRAELLTKSKANKITDTLGMPIKRFYLGASFNDVYLTAKEFECLILLVQSKSISEISDSMKISNRTAEVHIDHIKNKTGCHKIRELCYRLGSSPVGDILAKYVGKS